MFQKIKHKIIEIRQGDEDTKRTWLILSSSVTITLVIVLWIFYVRWAVLPTKQVVTEEYDQTGFWEIMKTGTLVTGKNIYHELWALVTQFKTETTITITQ